MSPRHRAHVYRDATTGRFVRRDSERRPRQVEREGILIRAESIDKEARKISVSFSSQTDNIRYGGYAQILLHESKAVDMSPLTSALLNHDPSRILGRIENARIDEGDRVGRADIVFDDDEEAQRAFSKVESGSLRGTSVRAKVHRWLVLEDKKTWRSPGGQTIRGPADVAVDWSVREVSLTPVPADISVGVGRSSTPLDREQEDPTMDPNLRTLLESLGLSREATEEEAWTFFREHQAEVVARMAQTDPDDVDPSRDDDGDDDDGDPAPGDPPPREDAVAVAAAAVRTERQRVSTIRDLCSRWPEHCGGEFERSLIDGDVREEVARERILSRLAERQQPTPSARRIEIVEEERDKIRVTAIDWCLERAGTLREHEPDATRYAERSTKCRELGFYNLFDLARSCLLRANVRLIGLGRNAIIDRAYSHSSSDFPYILENVLNKSLLKAYTELAVTFRPLVRIRSLADFKLASVTKLGDAGDLELTPDGVPIPESSLPEAKESYGLATYAKSITFGRQAIINDDMDAFVRVPETYGRAARRRANRLWWDTFLANPTMAEDTKALFASDHTSGSNVAGSGTAITVASLGAGRAAMRKQKAFTEPGETAREINVNPVFLVVGPDKETEADQVIGSVVDPSKQNAAKNPFVNRFTVIPEPLLTGNQWYLFASPGDIATGEVAFLDGREEPNTIRESGTNVLGMRWAVYLDMAAKVVEHRGVYKNAGA